jgi:hypothetical protein
LRYHINEGVITFPDTLVDRTVNMFMSPNGSGLSMVVSRDKLQAGESLDGFIKRQMGDLSRQVNKFEEIARAEATLGATDPGLKGVQIASRFKQHGQQVHQLQAVFLLPDGVSVLIVTGTALAPHTDVEKGIWKQTLSTFELRGAA